MVGNSRKAGATTLAISAGLPGADLAAGAGAGAAATGVVSSAMVQNLLATEGTEITEKSTKTSRNKSFPL
jgi:hypothetical protein